VIATEGDALLADILANPADDGLRLIYADWLEEQGQGERAEFVRLGVANEGEQPHNTFGPVGLREETLLYPRFAEWLGGLPALFGLRSPYADYGYNGTAVTVGWFWSRGFVSRIHCPQQAWLDHGAAIRAAHPVERVGLSDREPGASPCWAVADGRPDRPWHLPRCLFDLLPGGKWVSEERRRVLTFDTRQDAIGALSAACILLARQRHAPTDCPAQR
jgi:uncharacterized protein (TIGR02996 family)